MVNHTSLELHLQVWDNVGKVAQYTFPIFHTRRSTMNTKLVTAQIRVKNWATIIQDRNESVLSVKDYCTQHQLSRNPYYYWSCKVKETLLVKSGFVEVTQPDWFLVQKSAATDSKENKRLKVGTFQWSRAKKEARNITPEQYHLFMNGYSIDPFVHRIIPKHSV